MLHIDVLKSKCASTAMWRAEQVNRFPNDPRNAIARDLLLALAARPETDVSQDTRQRLAELCGPVFAEAIRVAAKEVAFRYTPHSLEDVAQRVLTLMGPTPAMDDPRFAVAIGGAR